MAIRKNYDRLDAGYGMTRVTNGASLRHKRVMDMLLFI